MATENIVTSKKFRICTDAVNKIYDRISFWTKASDVYNNSDKALETTCGSITGITSSLTSTSTTMAASASAIKQLNDKIADLNSKLTNEIGIIATDATNKTYSIDTKVNYVFVCTGALSTINSNHKKIEIGENYTENFSYDSRSVTINYTWNDRELTITRSSNYGITTVIIVY